MRKDINKHRLMSTANSLKKTKPAILRGVQPDARIALKYAWWFEDFRNQLRTGVYRFSYFKKEGGIREARGTLCADLIPEENMPKSGMDPDAVESVNTFRYYDLDAAGWRSFRLDNFIGFISKV